MLLRWLFAVVHLLGLGIGLGAVWARAMALTGNLDREGLRRVFAADTWWAIAAFIWIATGLVRLFAGLEKTTAYYLQDPLFWGKMVLLALVIIIEIAPMRAFVAWRRLVRTGGLPDTTAAPRYAAVSKLQAFLVVLMVLLATGMARGVYP